MRPLSTHRLVVGRQQDVFRVGAACKLLARIVHIVERTGSRWGGLSVCVAGRWLEPAPAAFAQALAIGATAHVTASNRRRDGYQSQLSATWHGPAHFPRRLRLEVAVGETADAAWLRDVFAGIVGVVAPSYGFVLPHGTPVAVRDERSVAGWATFARALPTGLVVSHERVADGFIVYALEELFDPRDPAHHQALARLRDALADSAETARLPDDSTETAPLRVIVPRPKKAPWLRK